VDLILYNPLSKNNKSNIQTHKLIRYYKKNNIPFRLKSIIKVKDIELFLEEKSNHENIILLGGDGTINRFINDTFDFDIKQNIYLKRNGSGNDYLRTLIDQDTMPQYIMDCSFDGNSSTKFINGAGMGIDGYVGYLIESSPRKGKLRYFLNTLRALIKYIPEPLDLYVDGTHHHFKKTYLVAMNNGKYFGGGMKVAPNASINDENLDVIVAHTISKLFILPIFLTIYLGLHVKFKKYIFITKGKHIKAKFTTPQISQTDGETYYDVTEIEVKSTGKQIHLKSYNNK